MNQEGQVSPLPGHSRHHPKTRQLLVDLEDPKHGIGAEIENTTLTARIGLDVGSNGPGYSYLQSAIRWCIRERGIYWERVWGQQHIKRLTPQEARAKGLAEIGSIRRRCRNARRKLATVDLNPLTDPERNAHLRLCVQLGIMEFASSDDARKQLEYKNAVSLPDRTKLLEGLI